MRISVMIPTYNCASFVGKTISSVLKQYEDGHICQIEVIDDCSSDNIEEVVQKVGKGRVSFFKQPVNVGHVMNFETALNRVKGEIVHLLHGDDYVLPGFYAEMIRMYKINPEIGACFCRHFFVDDEDNITQISELLNRSNAVYSNFHKLLIYKQKIQTPSITVKKDVYDQVGYFNPRLTWTEDWEMWVRICSVYDIGYVKEPLAAYRMHGNSSTGNKSISGENVKDLYRLKEILYKYTQNITEKKELDKSFKALIFDSAMKNYLLSKDVGNKYTYKHLNDLKKSSTNWKSSIIFYFKYLMSKYGC